MAKIQLEDVTVTRLNSRGHGVQVKEPDRQSNGETYRGDKYTLWFKEPSGLSEGDTVSVSGFLSAKVGQPWTGRDGETRHSVELSLNSPKVEGWPRKTEPAQAWGNDDGAEPF